MKKVVITGCGMVSPIGHNVKQSWKNLINGVSGINNYLNDPILKNQKPYNLALVKDFDLKKWKVPHANNRMNNFLHAATAQALQNCNIDLQKLQKDRAGICIGNMASSNTQLLSYIQESQSNNYTTINRLSMLQILTNIPCATLNVKYKFLGPSLTVSTACATGLSSIIEGYKWIKYGQADFVIAGATQDVYNPLYLNSSLRLQAMSGKQYEKPQFSSCPFDKSRSGFILGQGSGVVILQSQQHAKNRNAKILCEVLGYGYTSDGDHLVRPEISGKQQIKAMQLAVQSAQLNLNQIDHISAHATSTPAGDEIEAKSIKSLFGNKPTVSAIKSAIGHTFGSAGSIQLIFGVMSMRQEIIPKIYNLKNPQNIDINYVYQNKNQRIKYLLKNSFGFGGINVSAVIKNV